MSESKKLHYKQIFKSYLTRYYSDSVDINQSIDFRIPKYGIWSPLSSPKNISDEKTFLENYGNRKTSVSLERVTTVIEEYDNKISLKYFHITKDRRVGSVYFRVRRQISYCTYNLKTKNFYFGDLITKNKQVIRRQIRSNIFDGNYLTSLRLMIRRQVRELCDETITEKNRISNKVSEEIIKVYFDLIKEKTGIHLDCLSNNLDGELYKLYLSDNGFKYPNNYYEYTGIRIPKKVYRKEINLIKIIMSTLNLKGRKIRTLLNQGKNIDLQKVVTLYQMLGVDYFNELKDDVVQYENTPISRNLNYLMNVQNMYDKFQLNNGDKGRVVNILNDKVNFSLVADHLQMIEKLKTEYEHRFKMKFTCRESFNDEHYDLSELINSYKKGDITIHYGDLAVEKIEEPIFGPDGIDYYPVVLLTSKDFNEESQIQSNCVRTYVERPNMVIISLRQGSGNSEDRATLEYRFRRNEIIRTQSLGKFNKDLSPRYGMPLEVLDLKLKKLYHKDILHLPKMVKKFKSGRVIERNAIFKENENKINNIYPEWDNNDNCDSLDFLGFDLFM